MIIVPFEQGTPEWLAYRRQHGMASESPALLGSALYYPLTPFQLWLTKKGLAETPHHPGMTRGLEFESFARERFRQDYGLSMLPVVVEEDSHLLAASLDGYCEDEYGGVVLEIKHWSELGTMPAVLSDVWPAHYDQVQHQLAVTGASGAYVMYGNAERQSTLWVDPDEARQMAIRHAWGQFWVYMEGEASPPLSERDYEEGVCREAEFIALEDQYVALAAELDAAKRGLEAVRGRLIAFADGRNLRGQHVMVTQSYRSSIDVRALREEVDVARYKRMPQLVTTVRRV
jgi:putative phage-type endonuclease